MALFHSRHLWATGGCQRCSFLLSHCHGHCWAHPIYTRWVSRRCDWAPQRSPWITRKGGAQPEGYSCTTKIITQHFPVRDITWMSTYRSSAAKSCFTAAIMTPAIEKGFPADAPGGCCQNNFGAGWSKSTAVRKKEERTRLLTVAGPERAS